MRKPGKSPRSNIASALACIDGKGHGRFNHMMWENGRELGLASDIHQMTPVNATLV